ncbi:hypothetical protein WMY93_010497 [Mugilogobius chulae]|uniref:AIG1-type G domain-containing protein n=1 Tax=Mugilogobius chulae TaxID=88201 RepID=A0AAW0PDS8_9GOBI
MKTILGNHVTKENIRPLRSIKTGKTQKNPAASAHTQQRYQNRTILLVGATGTGKSTLINALVNFVMGVKFDDRVWFEIIEEKKDEAHSSQSHSQTSAVTVYEVYGFEGVVVPYSLTIIDTPGYGDTRGIEYDNIITKKLEDLFCCPDGVDTIDAVGLVVKATENRLDDRIVYIFNSITSLFGRNMEANIVAMMTHSDGMKPTNALQALNDAKIRYARNESNEPVYFLFNNCQKESYEKGGDGEKAARYANETAEGGLSKFTKFVGQSLPQSLKTTIKVMKERTRLSACIQNLQQRVIDIDEKQKALQNNKDELSKYKHELEMNKDFNIQVEETYKEREELTDSWDNRAVCCLECQELCHYPGCTWASNSAWCQVMDEDGYCTACTNKCSVKHHVKEKWKYVTKTRIVPKTSEEMRKKYEENKAKSAETTSLVEEMEKEISHFQQSKHRILDEIFNIIEDLQKIALNIESALTFVDLNFLIEKMKQKKDTEKPVSPFIHPAAKRASEPPPPSPPPPPPRSDRAAAAAAAADTGHRAWRAGRGVSDRPLNQKPKTMAKTYDYLFKLLLIGDSGVGKTCLLFRFSEDAFNTTFISTIVARKTLVQSLCPWARLFIFTLLSLYMLLWSLKCINTDRFSHCASLKRKKYFGIMLVYDITTEKSFDNIKNWIRNIEEHASSDVERMILGNKCDMNDKRQVSKERGEKLAIDYGIKFLETSAKSGINVEEAFFTLARDIMTRLNRRMNDNNPSGGGGPVKITENRPKKSFFRCSLL